MPSTTTVTGFVPTGTWPNVIPGQANTATAAEDWTVVTTDPAGYRTSITPGGATFNGPVSVPNSVLTVNGKVNGTSYSPVTFDSDGDSVNLGSSSAAGSFTEVDNWVLNAPSTMTPGTYTETFTYSIYAN